MELLIAIIILGIAGAAIVGSVRMSISATDLVKKHSKVMAALRSYGEAISNVGDASQTRAYAYKPCAGKTSGALTADFPSATTLQIDSPAGITMKVSAVGTWDGVKWVANTSSCVDANDLGLQKVTLTATSTGTGVTVVEGSLDVFIRKPCASTAAC